MSGFMEIINDAASRAVNANIKNYEQKQKNLFELGGAGKLAAVALAVVAVGLMALGLAFTSAGILGAFFGAPLIVVSSTLFYASYNAYQASNNILEVAADPKKFCTPEGMLEQKLIVNKEKLRPQIIKNTFCFEFIASKLVDSIKEF